MFKNICKLEIKQVGGRISFHYFPSATVKDHSLMRFRCHMIALLSKQFWKPKQYQSN